MLNLTPPVYRAGVDWPFVRRRACNPAQRPAHPARGREVGTQAMVWLHADREAHPARGREVGTPVPFH
jgi:hypothetical protein